MKTRFNMKSILLFALVLPLAFGLMACEEVEGDDEDKIFIGEASIIELEEGSSYYVTVELEAKFEGPEADIVTLQWNRDGRAIPGATGNKFTPGPEQGGRYTVSATHPDYAPKVSSNHIDVVRPDWVGFFGNWEMISGEQTHLNTTFRPNYNETVTITHERFYIADDTDPIEFVDFTISSWEPVASFNNTGPSIAEIFKEHEGEGNMFKVTGTIKDRRGYNSLIGTTPVDSEREFYLFLHDDSVSFIRTNFLGAVVEYIYKRK